jgi:restriction system protein
MAVWLIRAGRGGEREGYALENGVAVVGWDKMPDLSGLTTRELLLTELEKTYPEVKHRTRLNWRSQLWPLISTIQEGDLVVLPLKHRPAVAFGKVTGKYRHDPSAPGDAQHQRPVQWFAEVSRSAISQDLLFSMGAFMTVCQLTRNDAERRLNAIAAGGKDPVLAGKPYSSPEEDSEQNAEVDLEAVSREQIRQLIYAKFKGYDLARLVGAVLQAQGYRVTISPEGADGGVDVIAGTGPLGFESPRIIAQVKSDQGPVSVQTVRELQGVMKNFGADRALFVAWGGFKSSVIKEMTRQFFEIRLWTGDDLVDHLLHHFLDLPAEIRAELPLKQIWTVALAEE